MQKYIVRMHREVQKKYKKVPKYMTDNPGLSLMSCAKHQTFYIESDLRISKVPYHPSDSMSYCVSHPIILRIAHVCKGFYYAHRS